MQLSTKQQHRIWENATNYSINLNYLQQHDTHILTLEHFLGFSPHLNPPLPTKWPINQSTSIDADTWVPGRFKSPKLRWFRRIRHNSACPALAAICKALACRRSRPTQAVGSKMHRYDVHPCSFIFHGFVVLCFSKFMFLTLFHLSGSPFLCQATVLRYRSGLLM